QIEQLAEARVFTTLDLENSYFHVPIAEDSRKYTAFVTHEGQYEFCRAPFGLCTSGNAFCRFINSALRELINEGIIISFVDDIIIPTKNEQEGISSLKRVFEVAEKSGLKFNWKKCVFLQRRVEYLGYVVYDGRIEPAEQQIEKVKRYPIPKTAKQLQRFIGLANENRRDYNLRKRPVRKYEVADLVALPVTQFGPGRKYRQRFYGPYIVEEILEHDRLRVQKLEDNSEGPLHTTTACSAVKPWAHPGRISFKVIGAQNGTHTAY
uniref:Reverse transcriptase domain-containing protein n=1 Tax=Anopheles minimus TaxID=112268 RepID=A0A182W819_9DIPT